MKKNDLREDCESIARPICFHFKAEYEVGPGTAPVSVELVQVPEKPYGAEALGAAHMGCWLTEPDVIRDMPIGEPTLHGVVGHDLVYGWRLNEAGRVLAHDWSVGCRHWDQKNGRLQLV